MGRRTQGLARVTLLAAAVAVLAAGLDAQTGSSRGGLASIQAPELKEWLTYIASDELQGREVYTEGLGLAASYIAGHLKGWGVKPGVEDGTYFQTVKTVGVRNTGHNAVTVGVNGRSRTFKDGEGITFPSNTGGQRTVAGEDVLFLGYGLQLPAAKLDDYAGMDPEGKVVVWLGSSGPRAEENIGRRLLSARSRLAVQKGAIAVIGPASDSGAGGRGGRGARGGRGEAAQP
ncbi:MAG: hypothetical protein ACRD15_18390, partial [Vicinamibacterales bacterium]